MDRFPNFPKENWDALLHWQYVLKEEKILVQLPVDFDLITFTLLYIDKEETKLEVKLMYNNNSKCFQDDFSKVLLSIRFLLWNELFFNDTKYYLCNVTKVLRGKCLAHISILPNNNMGWI